MSIDLCTEELNNYRALVSRVDELCTAVNKEFAGEIACRPGCSGCCRELSLFPVEAASLLAALATLSPDKAARLAARHPDAGDGNCPLLADDGLCLVYDSRPIICRTHGLPLLLKVDGENRVDFCPENFQTAAALPGTAIINLELLNHALVAINALFVEIVSAAFLKSGQRLGIAALIDIWKGVPDDPA